MSFSDLFRKKKLTDHWRKFIHPIMWRCKWTELQIKELQSRALKYDRELAEYDLRKQVELEESTLGDFDSKSQPFYCQSRRNQIMKRKRRKRVEETTDLASYMSCHNLFSYHGLTFTSLFNAIFICQLLVYQVPNLFSFFSQNIRSPLLMVHVWTLNSGI